MADLRAVRARALPPVYRPPVPRVTAPSQRRWLLTSSVTLHEFSSLCCCETGCGIGCGGALGGNSTHSGAERPDVRPRPPQWFAQVDSDGSGAIDAKELQRALGARRPRPSAQLQAGPRHSTAVRMHTQLLRRSAPTTLHCLPGASATSGCKRGAWGGLQEPPSPPLGACISSAHTSALQGSASFTSRSRSAPP